MKDQVNKSKFTKQILKLLISVSLLIYAFVQVDSNAILACWKQAYIPLILLGYGLDQGLLLIQTFRWQSLLHEFHVKTSFANTLKTVYIGYFFNFFMPTSIGGDVARYFFISPDSTKKNEIATSIIAERHSGLLALFFISLVTTAFTFSYLEKRFYPFMCLTFFVFVISCLLVFIRPPKSLLNNNVKKTWLTRIGQPLIIFWNNFSSISSNRKLFWQTFFRSCLFQGGGLIIIYFFALALGISVPFPLFILFTTLIILMTIIPISICGIGLRETGFLYFFSQLDIAKPLILSLSMLTFSRIIIHGLIGGFLYLGHNIKSK